jgi:hypothetical protein
MKPMSLREGDQKGIVSGTRRSNSLSIVAIVIVAFAIFLVWRHTVGSHGPIGWNVWVYSEWLINYSGGFVRRGLAGEIIARLADGHSAARITTTLVFGLYLILSVLFLLLAMIGRSKNSASAIMLSVLIPGGIFAMARDNHFYYGKEILFLIGLEISCLLQLAIFSEWGRRLETVLIWIFLAVVFATGLLLPLVHEGYVFFGAPAIFILLYCLTKAYPNKSYLKSLLWAYPVLPVGAFFVTALFKGNASVALTIWNSLSESDRLIIAPLSPSKPCCSLAAIGFGMLHAIAGIKMLLAGGFWFWVFVIGCAFALLTLITALVFEPDGEAEDVTGLLDLLTLLFMATLPMYLIGEDWGRWIMIVTISYLLLLFTVSPRHVPGLALTRRMSPLISKAMAHRRAVVGFALLFCLTFSYPEWGYFPGQSSNPLSLIFTASQRLFHSVTPGASWVDTINHFDEGHQK